MAEIVNLRTVRKALKSVKKRAQADENASKFGRTTAERKKDAAEAEKARRDLDGHERE
tara:strand:- start:2185 stop:2358 length:174 start_codon:yes stop_codon:yes gene_type:complete